MVPIPYLLWRQKFDVGATASVVQSLASFRAKWHFPHGPIQPPGHDHRPKCSFRSTLPAELSRSAGPTPEVSYLGLAPEFGMATSSPNLIQFFLSRLARKPI